MAFGPFANGKQWASGPMVCHWILLTQAGGLQGYHGRRGHTARPAVLPSPQSSLL